MKFLHHEGWQNFLTLCREAHSNDLLDELFSLLFTLDEKEQFALRVQLIKELIKENKTQREIAQDLDVSIAKITRGSNALKIIGAELRSYLKKHLV